ncbi:hypothetical protein P171DRAFT_448504 [Karstenula rhodostoma CBS 690.94]|uniref:Uncharacterized protein n=1 Tax=Karstenula rhodostoma CBS 690.94 TaxID=1392251 RepID=A0A9P4P8U1_9PLEO|nr:hypothetical protein P171DRAFT_448504 [Karstenula rhodostoma CBS 690.94]
MFPSILSPVPIIGAANESQRRHHPKKKQCRSRYRNATDQSQPLVVVVSLVRNRLYHRNERPVATTVDHQRERPHHISVKISVLKILARRNFETVEPAHISVEYMIKCVGFHAGFDPGRMDPLQSDEASTLDGPSSLAAVLVACLAPSNTSGFLTWESVTGSSGSKVSVFEGCTLIQECLHVHRVCASVVPQTSQPGPDRWKRYFLNQGDIAHPGERVKGR